MSKDSKDSKDKLKKVGELLVYLSESEPDDFFEEHNVMTIVAGTILISGLISNDISPELVFGEAGKNVYIGE